MHPASCTNTHDDVTNLVNLYLLIGKTLLTHFIIFSQCYDDWIPLSTRIYVIGHISTDKYSVICVGFKCLVVWC